jgi:hypothetical protein
MRTAGDLGVEPVPGLGEFADPVQLGAGGQGAQVVVGEGVQRGGELAHDTSRQCFDQVFEVYRGRRPLTP